MGMLHAANRSQKLLGSGPSRSSLDFGYTNFQILNDCTISIKQLKTKG